MSINDRLGNGPEHRREIYAEIRELLGVELLPFKTHDKLKKIILSYVSDRQDDLIKRLQEAAVKESNLNDKIKLIAKDSHTLCHQCSKLVRKI